MNFRKTAIFKYHSESEWIAARANFANLSRILLGLLTLALAGAWIWGKLHGNLSPTVSVLLLVSIVGVALWFLHAWFQYQAAQREIGTVREKVEMLSTLSGIDLVNLLSQDIGALRTSFQKSLAEKAARHLELTKRHWYSAEFFRLYDLGQEFNLISKDLTREEYLARIEYP